MPKLTITEALQEIKTISKRLVKKRESLSMYLARDMRVRDPLEKDGGSAKFLAEERQSMHDLEERVITLRTAIQLSNLTAPIVVGGQSRSVAEWLTWRREISPNQVAFARTLVQGIVSIRQKAQEKGGRAISANVAQVVENYDPNGPLQVVVNLDEVEVLREQERLETILGDLDGKLSLFNATTVIEV